MISMPGARRGSGQVGSFGGALWAGIKATADGAACYASGGTKGCSEATQDAQEIYDQAKEAAGDAFVPPAGTPMHIAAQGAVDDMVKHAVAHCNGTACADDVTTYIKSKYDPWVTWWAAVDQLANDQGWDDATIQAATDKINGVYNAAYQADVVKGVAAILAGGKPGDPAGGATTATDPATGGATADTGTSGTTIALGLLVAAGVGYGIYRATRKR